MNRYDRLQSLEKGILLKKIVSVGSWVQTSLNVSNSTSGIGIVSQCDYAKTFIDTRVSNNSGATAASVIFSRLLEQLDCYQGGIFSESWRLSCILLVKELVRNPSFSRLHAELLRDRIIELISATASSIKELCKETHQHSKNVATNHYTAANVSHMCKYPNFLYNLFEESFVSVQNHLGNSELNAFFECIVTNLEEHRAISSSCFVPDRKLYYIRIFEVLLLRIASISWSFTSPHLADRLLECFDFSIKTLCFVSPFASDLASASTHAPEERRKQNLRVHLKYLLEITSCFTNSSRTPTKSKKFQSKLYDCYSFVIKSITNSFCCDLNTYPLEIFELTWDLKFKTFEGLLFILDIDHTSNTIPLIGGDIYRLIEEICSDSDTLKSNAKIWVSFIRLICDVLSKNNKLYSGFRPLFTAFFGIFIRQGDKGGVNYNEFSPMLSSTCNLVYCIEYLKPLTDKNLDHSLLFDYFIQSQLSIIKSDESNSRNGEEGSKSQISSHLNSSSLLPFHFLLEAISAIPISHSNTPSFIPTDSVLISSDIKNQQKLLQDLRNIQGIITEVLDSTGRFNVDLKLISSEILIKVLELRLFFHHAPIMGGEGDTPSNGIEFISISGNDIVNSWKSLESICEAEFAMAVNISYYPRMQEFVRIINRGFSTYLKFTPPNSIPISSVLNSINKLLFLLLSNMRSEARNFVSNCLGYFVTSFLSTLSHVSDICNSKLNSTGNNSDLPSPKCIKSYISSDRSLLSAIINMWALLTYARVLLNEFWSDSDNSRNKHTPNIISLVGRLSDFTPSFPPDKHLISGHIWDLIVGSLSINSGYSMVSLFSSEKSNSGEKDSVISSTSLSFHFGIKSNARLSTQEWILVSLNNHIERTRILHSNNCECLLAICLRVEEQAIETALFRSVVIQSAHGIFNEWISSISSSCKGVNLLNDYTIVESCKILIEANMYTPQSPIPREFLHSLLQVTNKRWCCRFLLYQEECLSCLVNSALTILGDLTAHKGSASFLAKMKSCLEFIYFYFYHGIVANEILFKEKIDIVLDNISNIASSAQLKGPIFSLSLLRVPLISDIVQELLFYKQPMYHQLVKSNSSVFSFSTGRTKKSLDGNHINATISPDLSSYRSLASIKLEVWLAEVNGSSVIVPEDDLHIDDHISLPSITTLSIQDIELYDQCFLNRTSRFIQSEKGDLVRNTSPNPNPNPMQVPSVLTSVHPSSESDSPSLTPTHPSHPPTPKNGARSSQLSIEHGLYCIQYLRNVIAHRKRRCAGHSTRRKTGKFGDLDESNLRDDNLTSAVINQSFLILEKAKDKVDLLKRNNGINPSHNLHLGSVGICGNDIEISTVALTLSKLITSLLFHPPFESAFFGTSNINTKTETSDTIFSHQMSGTDTAGSHSKVDTKDTSHPSSTHSSPVNPFNGKESESCNSSDSNNANQSSFEDNLILQILGRLNWLFTRKSALQNFIIFKLCHSLSQVSFSQSAKNAGLSCKNITHFAIARCSLLLTLLYKWLLQSEKSLYDCSKNALEIFWYTIESVLYHLHNFEVSSIIIDENILNIFLIGFSFLGKMDNSSSNFRIGSSSRRVFRDRVFSLLLNVLFAPCSYKEFIISSIHIKNKLIRLLQTIMLDVQNYNVDYSQIFTVSVSVISLRDICNLSNITNVIGLSTSDSFIHFNGQIKTHKIYLDIIYHIGILTSVNVRRIPRNLVDNAQYSGTLTAIDMLLNNLIDIVDIISPGNRLTGKDNFLVSPLGHLERKVLDQYSNFYQNRKNFRSKLYFFKVAIKSIWSFNQLYAFLFSDRFYCYSKYDGKLKSWKHLEALIYTDPTSIILSFNNAHAYALSKRKSYLSTVSSTIGYKYVIHLLEKLGSNSTENLASNNSIIFITRLFLFAEEISLISASAFINRNSLNHETGQRVTYNSGSLSPIIAAYFSRCSNKILLSNFMNNSSKNYGYIQRLYNPNITRLSYYIPLFVQLLRRDVFYVISNMLHEVISSPLLLPKECLRFFLALEYEVNLNRKSMLNTFGKNANTKSTKLPTEIKESIASTVSKPATFSFSLKNYPRYADDEKMASDAVESSSSVRSIGVFRDYLPVLSHHLLARIKLILSRDFNKKRYVDAANTLIKELLDISEDISDKDLTSASKLEYLHAVLLGLHIPLDVTIETFNAQSRSSANDLIGISGSKTPPLIKHKIVDIDRPNARLLFRAETNCSSNSVAVFIPFIAKTAECSNSNPGLELNSSTLKLKSSLKKLSVPSTTLSAYRRNRSQNLFHIRFNLSSGSTPGSPFQPDNLATINPDLILPNIGSCSDRSSDIPEEGPSKQPLLTIPSYNLTPSINSPLPATLIDSYVNKGSKETRDMFLLQSDPHLYKIAEADDSSNDSIAHRNRVNILLKPYYDGRREQFALHIAQLLERQFLINDLPLSFSIYTLIPCATTTTSHGCVVESLDNVVSAESIYEAGFASLSDYFKHKYDKTKLSYDLRSRGSLNRAPPKADATLHANSASFNNSIYSVNLSVDLSTAIFNMTKSFAAIAVLCYVLDIEDICPGDLYVNLDGSLVLTGSSLSPHSMSVKYNSIPQKLGSIFKWRSAFLVDLGVLLRESQVDNRDVLSFFNSFEGTCAVSAYSLFTYLCVLGRISCIEIAHELVDFAMLMADSGIFQGNLSAAGNSSTSSHFPSSASSEGGHFPKAKNKNNQGNRNDNSDRGVNNLYLDSKADIFSIKVDYLDDFQLRVFPDKDANDVTTAFMSWLKKWI